ncbi:hypothetical protein HGA92_02470 [Candidatus Gracilibacteria bacterium]|nr:hypothetical protein [Candidatus Gracilibacteria bacterium]NUJ99361.1 hypothetical protein [Candidatus Gracilibacteria bacterium]
MFDIPNGLTLGNYGKKVFSSIEEYGGKLGLLYLIAENQGIVQKLRDKGIIISKNSNPILISNKTNISEREYRNVEEQANRIIKKGEKKLLLRVSAPGDFRSFVDIFPTETIEKINMDNINKTLHKIREKIGFIKENILVYANGTGVPYREEDLSYGVVTKIDVPILTVTENPNTDDIFIDKSRDYGNYKDIKGETDSGVNSSQNGIKARKILEILREEKILDNSIAYQLELGELDNGKLILFQIKEFAKKNPLTIELEGRIKSIIKRIISGVPEGNYSLPIIYGGISLHGFGLCDKYKGSEKDICLALGNNSCKLSSLDYSSKPVGFIHGDAHQGVFNHNSFRMTQAVVQRGGIALLGNEINNYRNYLGFDKEGTRLNVYFYDGELKVSIGQG